MIKVLVVSLGGSIEPTRVSIKTHKPKEYLFVFSSQQSNVKLSDVQKECKTLSPDLKIKSFIVDKPEILVDCYEKALEIAAELKQNNYKGEDVVVDYTGGTKTMSASLLLATVSDAYQYSYVGGEERQKKGLGVVKTGSEEVKKSLSPWKILIVEDKKKISSFFNNYQFSPAKDMVDNLKEFLPKAEKAIFERLSEIIDGYILWESFNHKDAFEKLRAGSGKLSTYLELKDNPILENFLKGIKTNLGFLGRMKRDTQEFKKLGSATVFDLIYNSKRRAEEGKYDDAVARLYRALEMIGQIEFEREYGCSTSNADIDKLPDKLRDCLAGKYISENGKLKIPLHGTFLVLHEKGNKYGKKYFEIEGEIKKILSSRNNSILAHGAVPVRKETHEKFLTIIKAFLDPVEDDFEVEFPKLSW